jgi:hypothetical protein
LTIPAAVNIILYIINNEKQPNGCGINPSAKAFQAKETSGISLEGQKFQMKDNGRQIRSAGKPCRNDAS